MNARGDTQGSQYVSLQVLQHRLDALQAVPSLAGILRGEEGPAFRSASTGGKNLQSSFEFLPFTEPP